VRAYLAQHGKASACATFDAQMSEQIAMRGKQHCSNFLSWHKTFFTCTYLTVRV
jgi:hypothetical protein